MRDQSTSASLAPRGAPRRLAARSAPRNPSIIAPRPVETTTHRYEDREALYRALAAATGTWSGKLVIMAGHYMLAYRPGAGGGRLVPLIGSALAEDPAATEQERAYVSLLGDFPEATFEFGLRLIAERPDEVRRIMLLVNDHQFRLFQPDAPAGAALAKLRHGYYRGEDVPRVFREAIARHSSVGQVFEPHDARRSSNDVLPSRTVFFSEKLLQNRFLERKAWLLQRPGFLWKSTATGGRKLTYEPVLDASSLCLVDEGGKCGCSGAMIELLLMLAERGAEHIVLFVPEECRGAVDASIVAALAGLIDVQNVVAVWGGNISAAGSSRLDSATFYASSGPA